MKLNFFFHEKLILKKIICNKDNLSYNKKLSQLQQIIKNNIKHKIIYNKNNLSYNKKLSQLQQIFKNHIKRKIINRITVRCSNNIFHISQTKSNGNFHR